MTIRPMEKCDLFTALRVHVDGTVKYEGRLSISVVLQFIFSEPADFYNVKAI